MNDTLREQALRCLARREYTRTELARKLSPQAASVEDVEALEALLDHLTAGGLLSDQRYAEMRVNARSTRFGNARLAYELRTRGVAEEVVSETLAASEAVLSEWVRAQQVWQRKFKNLPAADEPKERARQMRFLMSRGFSSATIRRVLQGNFADENQ
jgi:regulatory protein